MQSLLETSEFGPLVAQWDHSSGITDICTCEWALPARPSLAVETVQTQLWLGCRLLNSH